MIPGPLFRGHQPEPARSLDRRVVLGLGDCAWIRNGANILISGPCGTGTSWIACALAHKACLEGHQAQYLRVPWLLTDLRIAHGEGTIPKLYRDLARIELLILADWGLAPIDAARARDLIEILGDRFGRRSAIPLADAILDRLVHGAIRFDLHGTSMRAENAGPGARK